MNFDYINILKITINTHFYSKNMPVNNQKRKKKIPIACKGHSLNLFILYKKHWAFVNGHVWSNVAVSRSWALFHKFNELGLFAKRPSVNLLFLFSMFTPSQMLKNTSKFLLTSLLITKLTLIRATTGILCLRCSQKFK